MVITQHLKVKTHKDMSTEEFDLWITMSLAASVPLARSTMRGIKTKMIGTAVCGIRLIIKSMIKTNKLKKLTPTHYGDSNHKPLCYSSENDD